MNKKTTGAGSKKYKFNREDFFNLLFRHTLKPDEYYYIEYFNKDKSTDAKYKTFHRAYKSIAEMSADIEKYKYYNDVYVSLATTKTTDNRQAENLHTRSVIAFDFDKKDYPEGINHKDILKKFQKIGIYYHAMVSSGNGYHVYLLVEPTQDIKKLVAVNKAIAQRLGADMQATSTTQILRVADTFNHKDSKAKQVKVIWLQADAKKRIEYNLDNLYKKYVAGNSSNKIGDSNIRYVQTNNTPPCIANILDGVEQGHRNFALGRLTKHLQRVNYSKDRAYQVIREWNAKCKPEQEIKRLEIDFNNYWDKDYKLLGCVTENREIQSILSIYCDKYKCKKSDKYEVIHTEKAIEIEYRVADRIRCKGVDTMLTGNHIAIISILKLFDAGLNRKQIEQELTHRKTKKQAISKNTLTKVLSELEQMQLVECKKPKQRNESNFYKLKNVKALENEKFVFGYGAIRGFLYGEITSMELAIYCYMRYRLSKGDNVVQSDIARDLSISQQAISKHIKSLEQSRYLIIHTDYSINPLGANMYEWIVQ